MARIKSRIAQSMLEYILIMLLVAVGILAMRQYVIRGVMGGIKSWEDQVSDGLDDSPFAIQWDATGVIGWEGYYTTNQCCNGNENEAKCNDGDVAIGYHDDGDDDVHCVSLIPPFGSGVCIAITSTYTTSQCCNGNENEAKCSPNDVMIGYHDDGDDDVHCARLAVVRCGPDSPELPPNLVIRTIAEYATSQGGGTDEAICSPGDVAIGYHDDGDDDVHCARLVIERQL
jgi:hypothetical protein